MHQVEQMETETLYIDNAIKLMESVRFRESRGWAVRQIVQEFGRTAWIVVYERNR